MSEEDYVDINRRSKVDQWDLLLTMIGTVGEICIVDQEAPSFAIKNVGLLKCGTELRAKWLYYFLRSPQGQQLIEQRKKGSTQQYISLTEVRNLPISYPASKADMHDAVSVLGVLDDRITLLRETNATLEAIAQALFKSWFVDFDPVRAKAEGRQPEGAIQGSMSAAEGRMTKAAMDATTAALFPDSFEESELGLVPKGWKVGTLGDIAQTARQQMQVSELRADLHYVGLEHIPRKSLSLTSWGNAEGLESAKAAFSEGDILFGKLRPYFHKVVISPFAGVCSTDILVCQPKIQNYFGVVAMHLFSETLINYADRLSNGAKMPRVNWKDLAAYQIVIPPAELAEKLNEAIHPLIARMMENTHQAQTLTQLRDTLLPRLISGQLRLPETARSETPYVD
ncbi:hypothetical protein BXT89_17855 [Halopseudomonas pachastrellae]|uniref:Type I restriction modification DNA specificity domain-containing protein n=1 Tax=Halopseudomonas pachastrellae TaxID=254161 RepID=A0A1S8DD45_9GAMM|nr:hypothetical protein BXT89_17855 [Halopseudomonas pachastrellae]